MNKGGVEGIENTFRMKLKRLKYKEVLLFTVLAALLLFAAWKVFGAADKTTQTTALSETEKKLVAILENIDGVGEAEVMVSETEDGEKSAVIVCEGARDIRVLIAVREAVATALGTAQKNVKIYLKKD